MRFRQKPVPRTGRVQPALAKWQAVASIVGSLAVPVVLAVFGYLIQRQLASEGLRKDYVQIAVSVLNQEPAKQEAELRLWAIATLESNSPIPFTTAVKDGLRTAPLSVNIGGGPTSQTECWRYLPPREANAEARRQAIEQTAACLVQDIGRIPYNPANLRVE